jgi:hypothetical protein
MATATPTLFYRGAAATTSTTLYTVPSSTSSVLTDIVVSNTSSNQQYVTITVDGINILPTVPVSANTVINLQPKTVIGTTKILPGFATSTDVKFHISGVEVTA